MNKNILIILGIIVANQAFADIGATNGVPNAATCNSGVLDTESGGAALQAQYIPETITLQWYDKNTLLNVTSTSSDSCTYGTGINLPTNPTKTGYTFIGWKVRPLYNFSSLPINIDGSYEYAKGTHFGYPYCYFKNFSGEGNLEGYSLCNTDARFAGLNEQNFAVFFSFGTIYGMSICSSTVPTGGIGSTGTPDESSEGTYCWCKATRYKPLNSDTVYAPTKKTDWLFYENISSYCKMSCPARCASEWGLGKSSSYRAKMFGAI